MSTISASTTLTTAFNVTGDTTGTLVLQTGATPTTAVTIDGSQNVGIGTSSPVGTMDVKSNGTTALQLRTSTSGSGQTGVLFRLTDSSNNYYANAQYQANQHIFLTGGTEIFRADSSGNLLVGGSTLPNSVRMSVFAPASGNTNGMAVSLANTAGDAITFYTSGTTNYAGKISVSGTTTSYISATSDYRLKENVEELTGALSTIQALRPVSYVWKASGKSDYGFIAHELQSVIPEAVVGEKDAVDENGDPKYQGVYPAPAQMIATLVKAIQELKAELDAAKADIATLKGAV